MSPCRELDERLAGAVEGSRAPGRGLIPAQDDIDVERVELDAEAASAGSLGGDEGRAGAKERVEDEVAAVGDVEEGIGEPWRRA